MRSTVPIDPTDRAAIDAHVDFSEQRKSRRGWLIWLTVAIGSGVAIYAATFDALPSQLRLGLVIGGSIGILLFLTFLSTKPFGRGYWDGPEVGLWWWRR